MTTQPLTLARSMRRFAVTRRRRIGALAGVRTAWFALPGAVALIYIDVLLQLASEFRLALLCAAGALAFFAGIYTYVRYSRVASETRLVARLVEQDDPSLRNDLINALEFEQVLALEAPLPVSRPLMQQGVSIASDRATHLERVRTLTPPSFRKELLALAGGLAVAALLALIFVDVLTAVVPRYLDPYGDHPPYSATRMTLDPAGVTVDYGEDIGIRATARGAQPEEVTLVLEDASGRITGELPMLHTAEGDYGRIIEHATHDLVYFARFDRGRSKRYALSIGKTPRIGAVNVSYTYPPYTTLPPRTRQLGPDAIIRAYEGTQIGIAIASNRPLAGGEMRVGTETVRLGIGSDPQSATGEFAVDRPTDIEARIVDVENNPSSDVLRAKVEVQPDLKPRIAIVSPGRQAFAIPTAAVPVEMEAQDDLGVANITLLRGLNGSGDFSKTVFRSEGGEEQANVVEVLDLADLGLRPGDVIDLYASASDTYPNAPQTEATASHRISIISEEQYRSFLQEETTAGDLKDRYKEVNARLETLATEQQAIEERTQSLKNTIGASGKPQPDDVEKLKELAKRQERLSEQTQKAADAMRQQASSPATFDIEKEFKKTLEEMASRLDRARDAMEKSAVSLNEAAKEGEGNAQESIAGAEENQKAALRELGQSKQQFAEQIDRPLDEIDRMYKLLEDVETFKAIYAGQVELERQARSYRDVSAPSLDQQVRLKELGLAQKEIRSATIDLRGNLEKHAAEIEPVLPKVARDARAIAEGIDGRNIPTVMEQAMSGLSSGDGGNGHQNAEEAAHLLEQLIQRVTEASGSSSETEQRLMITMGMNPGNTMSQLKRSLSPGFNPGQQRGGSSAGTSQSSNAFDMFGPEGNNKKVDKESAMSKRKASASAQARRDESEFAGAFEELDTDESSGPMVEAAASEPVAEEYRPLIEAYFQRIAEE